MPLLEKIRGTINSLFQLGPGGPNLKNSAGVIEARDAVDGAYARLRAAQGVAANDVVIVSQLTPSTGSTWATVGGVDSDYQFLWQALGAGKKRILIEADLTHNVATVAAGAQIAIAPGVTLTLDANNALGTSSTASIVIVGTSNSKLIVGPNVTTSAIGTSGSVIFNNLTISSGSTTKVLANSAVFQRYENCYIEGNGSNLIQMQWIDNISSSDFVRQGLFGCRVVGVASSTTSLISISPPSFSGLGNGQTKPPIISNTTFYGTWGATPVSGPFSGQNISASNDVATAITFELSDCDGFYDFSFSEGIINYKTFIGNGGFTVSTSHSRIKIWGDISVSDGSGFTAIPEIGLYLSDFVCRNLSLIGSGGNGRLEISSGVVGINASATPSSLVVSYGSIRGVRFLKGLTLSGLNSTVEACTFGEPPGGGTETLTINGNNTRVIANSSDVAIIDAGVGTVLFGNTVF